MTTVEQPELCKISTESNPASASSRSHSDYLRLNIVAASTIPNAETKNVDTLRACLFAHRISDFRLAALENLCAANNKLDVLFALSDPRWDVRARAAECIWTIVADPARTPSGDGIRGFPLGILAGYFESPIVPELDPRMESDTPKNMDKAAPEIARIRARHGCLRVFQGLRESEGTEQYRASFRQLVKRQIELLNLAPLTVSDIIPLDGPVPVNPFRIAKAPCAKLLRQASIFGSYVEALGERDFIYLRWDQKQLLLKENSSMPPVLREIRQFVDSDLVLNRALLLPAAS